MKQFLLGALAAMLAMSLVACQTANGGSASGDGAVMKINGRPVTAEELIKSPHLRSGIRDYIFYESLRNEAKKAGAKVDEAKFNEQLEEYKRNVQAQGMMTWEEYLEQTGQSEAEVLAQMREQMLFQELADARIKVTDEEVQRVWETDKDSLISQHLAENHLPDSERENITFEKVEEQARERVKMQKGMMEQGAMVADIILNAEIDIVALKGSEQQLYEDLILNNSKEQAREQQAQMEEQAAAMEAAESGQGGATATGPDGQPIQIQVEPEAGDGADAGAVADGEDADIGGEDEDEAPEAEPEAEAGE